jgi:hypothetical protein
MTENTPGPWAYDPKINRIYSLTNNMCVSAPHIAGNPTCDEIWPADARLIAAAPDLLAALQSADHCFSVLGYELPFDVQDMIRAAIAKAEGRS